MIRVLAVLRNSLRLVVRPGAHTIRNSGVSEVVKDAGAGPEDQIWEQLPCHTRPWSEIAGVFYAQNLPQTPI
jgi:hypothetical protein